MFSAIMKNDSGPVFRFFMDLGDAGMLYIYLVKCILPVCLHATFYLTLGVNYMEPPLVFCVYNVMFDDAYFLCKIFSVFQ